MSRGTAGPASCAVCGFSAVADRARARCPNCGTELAPPASSPSPVAASALSDHIEAWPEQERGRLLVEIARRSPGRRAYRDSPAPRESIRIRRQMSDWAGSVMNALLPPWIAGCAFLLVGAARPAFGFFVAGVLVATIALGARWRKIRRETLVLDPEQITFGMHRALSASRVRAVQRRRSARGHRVLLLLDDARTVCAFDRLSEHQARYLAELVSDVLHADLKHTESANFHAIGGSRQRAQPRKAR